jgi:hypothetical protein
MDKLHHLVYTYAISITVGIIFTPITGLIAGCVVGVAKDFILDLWLKKGRFEWLDVAASILGAVLATILIWKW